ncbi:uncharacterized protein LOC134238973 [Saccostrea cucullata]|uniref:uncharacterized protein LOC134238973 n=1 Tax=Saccostrea cuccullata TaxID=36930 RepID=UPI002ED0D1EB
MGILEKHFSMSRRHGSRRFKGHIGDANYTKLQRSVKNIKKNLSVDHILDDLISNEVLSIEDGIDIQERGTNHSMADVLIRKLIHVGEEGFHIFLEVLRENGYGHLIEFESPGTTQRSPTESSDPITTHRTFHPSHSLEHSHSHHVQFSEPVQQQFNTPTQLSVLPTQKPQGHSILVKPSDLPLEKRHDLPLATTMNEADTPSSGKDEDGKQDEDGYDEVEEVHCYVDFGPKTENVILSDPIPYRGNPALFDSWYPVKNMDRRLRDYPGCHPDVDERNIKRIIRENKARDGDYVIWYSQKRELLIVTIIYKSSPKGRYHYKVKRRRSGNEVKYRFSSQKQTSSVIELLEYVKAEGLPPPVQKSHSNKEISSK